MKTKWQLICLLVLSAAMLTGCPTGGQAELQGTWTGTYYYNPTDRADEEFTFSGNHFSVTGPGGTATGTYEADPVDGEIDLFTTEINGSPSQLTSLGVYRVEQGTLYISESIGSRPSPSALDGYFNVFVGVRSKSAEAVEGSAIPATGEASDSLLQWIGTPAQ